MWRLVSSLLVCLGIALALLSAAVEAVRERKLYDTLSVAPDATEQEIKKAYRKGALCVPPCSFSNRKSRSGPINADAWGLFATVRGI